ncbi:MAG: citryl-CoA lyase [Cucumibacter sp.]
MQIGEPGRATSAISTASAEAIEVRGRDLCADLMGKFGFTDYFHLLLTGQTPTDNQRFFLDLMLVAIAEHGLVPSVQAARMTLAAGPEALQGAVAAGILGAGSVILGASEACAAVLTDGLKRIAGGAKPETAALAIAEEIKARGERAPGFGHPMHRPVDPRAERILGLADDKKVSGRAVDFARELHKAIKRVWKRDLPMNVSMPIAAVMLDLNFPAGMIKAIPILARTAGLLAHLAEEQANPIGFRLAAAAEVAIAYEPTGNP